TREKRARNTIARQKTVGKTSKHPTASQHPGVSAPRKEHMRNPTPLYEGKNRPGHTGSDIRNEIHVEIQRGAADWGKLAALAVFQLLSSVVIQLLMLIH
ncbi:hypothetical protein, partial [Bifidobacterium sp.]|uniref:hypothetical protein n=1 Tax=Bifidobacterium sp. TaxID=41200 RepID=UPI0028FE3956